MYKDKEKQKEVTRLRQNRVRQQLYDYKSSTPCKDCGQIYPYWIMQFDHINKDKSFIIGRRSASFGSKKVADEINKCELVCANCHATRTHLRNLPAIA